jgi:hypothetical protein
VHEPPGVETTTSAPAPMTAMGALSESTLNLVAQVSQYNKRHAHEKDVTWVKKIFGIGVCSLQSSDHEATHLARRHKCFVCDVNWRRW